MTIFSVQINIAKYLLSVVILALTYSSVMATSINLSLLPTDTGTIYHEVDGTEISSLRFITQNTDLTSTDAQWVFYPDGFSPEWFTSQHSFLYRIGDEGSERRFGTLDTTEIFTCPNPPCTQATIYSQENNTTVMLPISGIVASDICNESGECTETPTDGTYSVFLPGYDSTSNVAPVHIPMILLDIPTRLVAVDSRGRVVEFNHSDQDAHCPTGATCFVQVPQWWVDQWENERFWSTEYNYISSLGSENFPSGNPTIFFDYQGNQLAADTPPRFTTEHFLGLTGGSSTSNVSLYEVLRLNFDPSFDPTTTSFDLFMFNEMYNFDSEAPNIRLAIREFGGIGPDLVEDIILEDLVYSWYMQTFSVLNPNATEDLGTSEHLPDDLDLERHFEGLWLWQWQDFSGVPPVGLHYRLYVASEPATGALMFMGMLGIAWLGWKRNQSVSKVC